MSDSEIKVNLHKPDDISILNERYTETLAGILIKKLPHSSIDIFIDKLNTNLEDIDSLKEGGK